MESKIVIEKPTIKTHCVFRSCKSKAVVSIKTDSSTCMELDLCERHARWLIELIMTTMFERIGSNTFVEVDGNEKQ